MFLVTHAVSRIFIQLTADEIRERWEPDYVESDQSLGDWLETPDIGDEFENTEERVKFQKIS